MVLFNTVKAYVNKYIMYKVIIKNVNIIDRLYIYIFFVINYNTEFEVVPD